MHVTIVAGVVVVVVVVVVVFVIVHFLIFDVNIHFNRDIFE
jgi:hypothetical protein